MQYELTIKPAGKKPGTFIYSVIDEAGTVLTTRKSFREYVAATIDGKYFFGRLDLVGKGSHGSYLNWCQKYGKTPSPVAYMKIKETANS